MKFRDDAFEQLKDRGFFYLMSHEEETKKILKGGPITFYLGIDPTADDLHIGHFFALQMFRILQDCGHKGILLIGGATAMIGDPSFKSDMRKIMTKEEVDRNVREINGILHRFIKLDGDNPAIVVNNADWIRPRGYIEFLREVGVHFNVAKMLSAECYKNRLAEGGLTFLEMGYMLMQAFDFVHLNDAHNCVLQIGGSDQWGNILAGVELSRKMSNHKGEERPMMMGLCCPLLTNANGVKMGKTEKGTLWVSRDRTSAFDFFQHFVNCMDADVERLLRFFTKLEVSEIQTMIKEDIMKAKKLMAFEVVKLVHGEDGAREALETSEKLFTTGDAENAPSFEIGKEALEMNIADLLVATSFMASKGEARRMIDQGGIAINGEKASSFDRKITADDFKDGYCMLKKGKKNFLKVVIK